jgi:hypothetical protein
MIEISNNKWSKNVLGWFGKLVISNWNLFGIWNLAIGIST